MPGGVGFAEGRILRLTKLSSLQDYMCPKFSIIIPVYNVAPYLRECLDSVFKQTFEDWEAVCVDDGSTDGSGAILDEYASKDVRFNVIHKSNGGVVSARKTGYDASKGDWIWFVDGDDLIKLTALETLDRAVKLDSFDMLRFQFARTIGRGEDQSSMPQIESDNVVKWLENIKDTPLELVGMCVWDKIYKRSLVDAVFHEIGSIRIKHSEDGLFAFTSLMFVTRYAQCNATLYYYIDRPSSAIHRFNPQIVDEKKQFIQAIEAVYRKSNFFRETGLCFLDFHYYEAVTYITLSLLRWRSSFGMFYEVAKKLAQSGFQESGSRYFLTGRRRRRLLLFASKHPVALLVIKYICSLIRYRF